MLPQEYSLDEVFLKIPRPESWLKRERFDARGS